MSPQEAKTVREDQLDMTQAQLAEEMGVDVMTVSRMERGVTPVTRPMARLLNLLVENQRLKAQLAKRKS